MFNKTAQFKLPNDVEGSGHDMGAPTIGYRSSKFNPYEWKEATYEKFDQSMAAIEEMDRSRTQSEDAINKVRRNAALMQDENTKRLEERVRDIHAWKQELHSMINDMTNETDTLCLQKKRLEMAIRALELPHHIALDNLNCRQKRLGIDHVQDDVELALLKEMEIINNAADLLKRTLQEVDIQINRNRAEKENLEFDWSDKKEAQEIDDFCYKLKNHHTSKMYFPGVARLQQIQSTPESWAQFTQDNIESAEQERLASIKLRNLVDDVIKQTNQDVIQSAQQSQAAFERRIGQMEEAKTQIEESIRNNIDAISKAEKKMDKLKKILRDVENPMKVAQTRLHYREKRPRVELCRDPAQFGLIDEVMMLNASNEELLEYLEEMDDHVKRLEDQRMVLEKDLLNKKNSLFIDREKCLPFRVSNYPTITKLQGY